MSKKIGDYKIEYMLEFDNKDLKNIALLSKPLADNENLYECVWCTLTLNDEKTKLIPNNFTLLEVSDLLLIDFSNLFRKSPQSKEALGLKGINKPLLNTFKEKTIQRAYAINNAAPHHVTDESPPTGFAPAP